MRKIIILVFIAIVALFIAGCNKEEPLTAESSGDYISIPLSDLSTTARFYTFTDKRVDISYFVVLGSDGEPRTAFDACDVCGGYKGYQQKGGDIRCRNCGKVFRIDGLGTKNKGYGCWPSYLPHEIEGDNLMIKVSDIKGGRSRFA